MLRHLHLPGLLALAAMALPSIGVSDSSDGAIESTLKVLGANTIDDFDLSAPLFRTLGKKDAPVVMLEFSDYRCSHCAIFHEIVFPKIKEDYIDTGKLFYVALHFPNKKYEISSLAAEAVYCGDAQGKFWEMRDLLFAESLYLSEESIRELARSIGLNLADFEACLQAQTYAELVADEKICGKTLGIKVTPSFVLAKKQGDRAIGGFIVKGLPKWTKFDRQIAEAIEYAEKGP